MIKHKMSLKNEMVIENVLYGNGVIFQKVDPLKYIVDLAVCETMP